MFSNILYGYLQPFVPAAGRKRFSGHSDWQHTEKFHRSDCRYRDLCQPPEIPFYKGFFGANGVNQVTGFMTPDVNEVMVKECAMKHSQMPYVLCDSSKFRLISPVSFGEFGSATIITSKIPDESYQIAKNLIIVD